MQLCIVVELDVLELMNHSPTMTRAIVDCTGK